jgi:hypothetical protein
MKPTLGYADTGALCLSSGSLRECTGRCFACRRSGSSAAPIDISRPALPALSMACRLAQLQSHMRLEIDMLRSEWVTIESQLTAAQDEEIGATEPSKTD